MEYANITKARAWDLVLLIAVKEVHTPLRLIWDATATEHAKAMKQCLLARLTAEDRMMAADICLRKAIWLAGAETACAIRLNQANGAQLTADQFKARAQSAIWSQNTIHSIY